MKLDWGCAGPHELGYGIPAFKKWTEFIDGHLAKLHAMEKDEAGNLYFDATLDRSGEFVRVRPCPCCGSMHEFSAPPGAQVGTTWLKPSSRCEGYTDRRGRRIPRVGTIRLRIVRDNHR